MIDSRDIEANSVIAVSSLEKQSVVDEAIKDRGYSFRIVLDQDGALKEKFKVSSTPTIFLVNPDLSVAWSSTGLSPTLEFRINSFLDRAETN